MSFGDIKDIPTEKERKQTLIAQNIAKLSVESIMVASKKLKGRTIPDAVKKLDNMVVFPIDSYSLTKFIHASGINCRYLGLMYMCSTSFQVKQMLLCEAVARTVKTLLKQVLQQLSRRGKAESQMAEERRRSKESHFEQHQQSLLAAKRAAVVDMFNLVLGTGQNCDEFWTGGSTSLLHYQYMHV